MLSARFSQLLPVVSAATIAELERSSDFQFLLQQPAHVFCPMHLNPIAHIRSPYKQKFAIPRQPGLVKQAVGEVVFEPDYADANALRGLEAFSHLWLVFGFHATADAGWSATVTPPRLGGTTRIGVFATRSTHRPNPLGLSAVEFIGIEQHGSSLVLKVRGIDLLDGTPVFDIKPYIPYTDALPDTRAGYASESPVSALTVSFTHEAQTAIEQKAAAYPELKEFIIAVLQQDPRPAQHVRQASEREYGMFLYDFNIRWHMQGNCCEVLSVSTVSSCDPDSGNKSDACN